MRVFSFEISVIDAPWPPSEINHTTAGKAKSEYMRRLADCWPEIPFTALRCRKIGQPATSSEFIRNAEYRGLPNVRCGDRVRVGESAGVIVGHNSSANFDVLFAAADPKYPGLMLNVHPSECKFESAQTTD